MNIFVNWINEEGDPEIATPPLDGSILPGVTRKSLLELGKTWGTHKVVERKITMADVRKAVKENRVRMRWWRQQHWSSNGQCGPFFS